MELPTGMIVVFVQLISLIDIFNVFRIIIPRREDNLPDKLKQKHYKRNIFISYFGVKSLDMIMISSVGIILLTFFY